MAKCFQIVCHEETETMKWLKMTVFSKEIVILFGLSLHLMLTNKGDNVWLSSSSMLTINQFKKMFLFCSYGRLEVFVVDGGRLVDDVVDTVVVVTKLEIANLLKFFRKLC